MLKKLFKFWPLFLSPISIVILSYIFPFTSWPEMLNWPFLMSHGWLPYKDLAIVHTPLLPYLLLATYNLIGFSPATLHLFGTFLLAITGGICTFIIFLLTQKRILSVFLGFFVTVLVFAFNGNHVWFENLLAPFLLGVFYFQWSYFKKANYLKIIFSGLLMGLALTAKQTAAYVLPAYFVFLLYVWQNKKVTFKELLKLFILYFLPIFTVVVIMLLLLGTLGVLPNFLKWAVEFVFQKPFAAKGNDSYVLLPNIRQILILLPFFCLPLIAAVWKRKFNLIYPLSWLILTALLAYPRFDYFHLVPAVFFLTVFIGIAYLEIPHLVWTVSVTALIVLSVFICQKNLYYTHTFLESRYLTMASYISQNYQNDSFFILNDPEQIYFLTRKVPAVRPWVPQLPWYLEYYDGQFFRDILKSPPEIILASPYLAKPISGLGAYQPKEVVNYISRHYIPVKIFPGGIKLLKKI